MDYPRSELAKVRTTIPKAVTCEYELEDEDIEPIEDSLGAGILTGRIISVCSLYDNTKQVSGVLLLAQVSSKGEKKVFSNGGH